MLSRGEEGRSWSPGSTRAVTLASRPYHQPSEAGLLGRVHAFALDPLPVRLGLIGTFALTAGTEPIELPPAAQRLVAFLALQERPVRREHVAGRLWPEVAEARAHAALRTTLWRATRACASVVWSGGPHLALASGVDVDLHAATRRARAVIERRDTDHRPLIAPGELLPDWYDDWVVYERERLRQLRLHALELRCDELARQGRYAEATDAGLAAVAGDPLRETAQRVLIAAYLAEGNVSDALRQYDLYRRALAETLGLTPSARMHTLVASVHER